VPVIVAEKGSSGQMMLCVGGQMVDVGLKRREVSRKGFEQKPKGLPPIPRWYHGSLMGGDERLDELFCRDMEIY